MSVWVSVEGCGHKSKMTSIPTHAGVKGSLKLLNFLERSKVFPLPLFELSMKSVA